MYVAVDSFLYDADHYDVISGKRRRRLQCCCFCILRAPAWVYDGNTIKAFLNLLFDIKKDLEPAWSKVRSISLMKLRCIAPASRSCDNSVLLLRNIETPVI